MIFYKIYNEKKSTFKIATKKTQFVIESLYIL